MKASESTPVAPVGDAPVKFNDSKTEIEKPIDSTSPLCTPELLSQTPPFNADVHLCAPSPDQIVLETIKEFREKLQVDADLYDAEWATDAQLHRCLIAKQFNMPVAMNLATEALKWRKKRAPHLIESTEGWQRAFEIESETGKTYSPGFDKWGRPVVVFDNGAQNTSNVDAQMLYLGWILNLACREMPQHIDKYTIFMNLESFSFFNIPSMSATTETIHMLCNTFPERLGHCIAYKPPGLFKTFWNSVKSFIDPKTAAKMVFLTGDMSDGSKNDLLMRDLIGDHWKVLTGAEQPVRQKTNPPSSPGYLHSEYWPVLMKRVEVLREKEKREAELKHETKTPSPITDGDKAALTLNESPSAAVSPTEVAFLPMYADDEDIARTTYCSASEFRKAKTHSSAPVIVLSQHEELIPQRDEGVVLTALLFIVQSIFYFLEDLLLFKRYLSNLFDTFLGPSTGPTKMFIRFTMIMYKLLSSKDNPKLRFIMFCYIAIFTILFFLFHDLRHCKKYLHEFIRQHAL